MIFILHYYSDLNILNNTQNKYCGNNVCEMKQHGHNVEDIRLVQLIKLLVLIIVNVVITWIFVDIIFNILFVAAAVFELTIFALVLSNIYLWLMLSFAANILF